MCTCAYHTDAPLPTNIKLKAMPSSAEDNIFQLVKGN